MGGIYLLLRMKLVHPVLNGLKGSNCDGMGKQEEMKGYLS